MTDNPEYIRVAQQYGIDADALRYEWEDRGRYGHPDHATLDAAAEAVRSLDQDMHAVSADWAARYVARHRAARRARLPWWMRWLA